MWRIIISFRQHFSNLSRHCENSDLGTNFAPLVACFIFIFFICYERDLSEDTQADSIKDFDSTPRYLDDLLNIDNPYVEGMVIQLYPNE